MSVFKGFATPFFTVRMLSKQAADARKIDDKKQLIANTHTVIIPAKAGIYQKMNAHLRSSDQSDGCILTLVCTSVHAHWGRPDARDPALLLWRHARPLLPRERQGLLLRGSDSHL